MALLGNVVVRWPGEPQVYAETVDLHERFAPGNQDVEYVGERYQCRGSRVRPLCGEEATHDLGSHSGTAGQLGLGHPAPLPSVVERADQTRDASCIARISEATDANAESDCTQLANGGMATSPSM